MSNFNTEADPQNEAVQQENKPTEQEAEAPVEEVEAEETEATEEYEMPTKRKKSLLREVYEWVASLIAAVLVVALMQTFVCSLIRVDGESMLPTLENGERLFVTVYDVKFGEVERGDVVICNYYNRTTEYLGGLLTLDTSFVKRIVGMPGDIVYRSNGVTYVQYIDENGEEITTALDPMKAGTYVFDDYEPYTLGEDEYFVVGDNRGNSHDSRDWKDRSPSRDVGPITRDMITGHVRAVIWPLNAIRSVE